MAIFYQHIGEKLWARDSPRSIGTAETGLVRFTLSEVEPFLGQLPGSEVHAIRSAVHKSAPDGFQIWGLLSGAERVLKPMQVGDVLLLLESTAFRYIGNVVHRLSEPCWDLSTYIWGEARFPLI